MTSQTLPTPNLVLNAGSTGTNFYIDNYVTGVNNTPKFNVANNVVYFFPGNYYLKTNNIKITTTGVQFYGVKYDTNQNIVPADASLVHIFQQSTLDLLILNADNFTMSGISLHMPQNNNQTGSALIVASANNTNITNNYIYGGSTTNFTIYYAGPKFAIDGITPLTPGQPSMDIYLNNVLDKNNTFSKNVVYTSSINDAISFSLQSNFMCSNNIFRGARVALYMCKWTKFIYNTIYNSVRQGIFVSLPCQNILIKGNNIHECFNSSIQIAYQLEHLDEFGLPIYVNQPNYINIIENELYDSQYFGIQMENANNINIANNKIKINNDTLLQYINVPNANTTNPLVMINKGTSIFIQNSSYVEINKNMLINFYQAFTVYGSSNVLIQNNDIAVLYPNIFSSTNIIILSNVNGNTINRVINAVTKPGESTQGTTISKKIILNCQYAQTTIINPNNTINISEYPLPLQYNNNQLVNNMSMTNSIYTVTTNIVNNPDNTYTTTKSLSIIIPTIYACNNTIQNNNIWGIANLLSTKSNFIIDNGFNNAYQTTDSSGNVKQLNNYYGYLTYDFEVKNGLIY